MCSEQNIGEIQVDSDKVNQYHHLLYKKNNLREILGYSKFSAIQLETNKSIDQPYLLSSKPICMICLLDSSLLFTVLN